MRLSSGTKGFTLLEVLIVIIILAVLAGLAIPAYQGAIEKSRAQEALTSLAAARESMIRYFAINGTYATATFTAGPNSLDYNPNTAVGGQTLLFTYTLPVQTANTFTIRARRSALTATDYVEISEAGVVTKSGVYS